MDTANFELFSDYLIIPIHITLIPGIRVCTLHTLYKRYIFKKYNKHSYNFIYEINY